MDWGINDSLKSRAFGQKKEIDDQKCREKAQSYERQGGQYYPSTKGGNLDEWGAMVKLQTARYKRDEEEMKQKEKQQKLEYQRILQQQMQEKQIQQMRETSWRKRDQEVLKAQEDAFQHQNQNKSFEDEQQRNYLKDQYQKKIEEEEQVRKMQKEQEQIEDQRRLEEVQRDLERQKQRQQQMKERSKQEMEQVFQMKQTLNSIMRAEKEKLKQDYQQQVVQNSQREIQKEQNYKQYFKDYESNMEKRMNMHLDHVVKQEVEKQHQLDELENQNEQKHRKWLDQKAHFDDLAKKRKLMDTYYMNRKMIENRWKQDVDDKDFRRKQGEEERQQQDQSLQEYNNKQKEDLKRRMHLYKETLDHQMKIKEVQKGNFGTMTKEEKKLNKMDLASFKHNENQVQALIPGINNLQTVGASPLKRGGHNILYSSRQPSRDYQNLISGSNSSARLLHESHNGSLQDIQMDRRDINRYNPITNPIPWENQNPYLKKERYNIRNKSTSFV